MVTEAGFEALAERTGFPGWRASEIEVKTVADSADTLAQIYFPNLSEKASVTVVCLFNIGVVFGSKYLAQQKYQRELDREYAAKRQAAEANARPETPPPGVAGASAPWPGVVTR